MSYITFANLGAAADLGSQLQQYSSLYAVAKANNKMIVFPESSLGKGWGFKFNRLIEQDIVVKPDSFFRDFATAKPNGTMLVDETMFNLDPDTNYNVDDLFHTFHYWNPRYTEDVLGWEWNREYYQKALELIQPFKALDKELVSIHVRRGDYLLPQHHHFCKLDTDYYGKAIESFVEDIEKYHFLIFSNDIEWCKQNLIEGEMVTFMPQGVDCVDLMLMSLCDHNIVANSSFSWWAAFRNKNANKKVICPKNYLKAYSPVAFINGHYYPNTWTSIDNEA